jgi:hypothetical protein
LFQNIREQVVEERTGIAVLAAEYRLIDVVSEQLWQVGEGGKMAPGG